MTKTQKTVLDQVQKDLFSMQDESYKSFMSKLIPNIPVDKQIGIRNPVLRKYAKSFAKSPEAQVFISILPHNYYEENNLHSYILETIKDFDQAVAAVDTFLPYVDNWATCDSMSPKVFKKQPEPLIPHIKRWLSSSHTYTIRFAIEMLMSHFLDEKYQPEYPALVAPIRSDEYYVNMMIAWYFATALAKQYQSILPFIENKALSPWTHNKSIQKAIESHRITDEQKAYLRSLKV